MPPYAEIFEHAEFRERLCQVSGSGRLWNEGNGDTVQHRKPCQKNVLSEDVPTTWPAQTFRDGRGAIGSGSEPISGRWNVPERKVWTSAVISPNQGVWARISRDPDRTGPTSLGERSTFSKGKLGFSRQISSKFTRKNCKCSFLIDLLVFKKGWGSARFLPEMKVHVETKYGEVPRAPVEIWNPVWRSWRWFRIVTACGGTRDRDGSWRVLPYSERIEGVLIDSSGFWVSYKFCGSWSILKVLVGSGQI